eukprot:6197834-Pleurochrysis_carterae.AAC.8
MVMAAQRAATLSRIDSAAQPCMRPGGALACFDDAAAGEKGGGGRLALLRSGKSGDLRPERGNFRSLTLALLSFNSFQLANMAPSDGVGDILE